MILVRDPLPQMWPVWSVSFIPKEAGPCVEIGITGYDRQYRLAHALAEEHFEV